jgi:hypothetical protein
LFHHPRERLAKIGFVLEEMTGRARLPEEFLGDLLD